MKRGWIESTPAPPSNVRVKGTPSKVRVRQTNPRKSVIYFFFGTLYAHPRNAQNNIAGNKNVKFGFWLMLIKSNPLNEFR